MTPLLIAQGRFAIDDVIMIIVFTLGFIGWLVSQLAARRGRKGGGPPVDRPAQAQRPAQRPAAPRPAQRPVAPRPAQRPAAPRPVGDPRDEVEDFLRRVADRRAGAKPQEVEVLEPQPPRVPPPRPQPAVPVQAEVVEAKTLESEPTVFPGSSVTGHVEAHLGKDDTDQVHRLRKPGRISSPDMSDDMMEEHIHEVFDHKLGSLVPSEVSKAGVAHAVKLSPLEPRGGRRQDETVELPRTAAAGLTALLADTRSLRQAIIINEILTRPDHNW